MKSIKYISNTNKTYFTSKLNHIKCQMIERINYYYYPLGTIRQNLFLLTFFIETYSQLKQKCKYELSEDLKKDTIQKV